jgi:5-formyltetrahydrofolate cyclo-ligase
MNDAITVKARFRAEAMARRDALSATERAAASAAIADRAEPIIAAAKPSVVSFYWPMRSECDVRPLIARIRRRGIQVALPAKLGDVFVFRRWAEGEPLHSGTFGTTEPPPASPAVNPDFIVLPLLGFDRFGNRIGYGKGHYDRAIAALRANGYQPGLLGVAFSVQEVPAVPAQPHDVRLDWVVTEHDVLSFV